MTRTTQHLIRNLSNLLVRGGGGGGGLSAVFLATSDSVDWIWLGGIGLGASAALIGIVLLRYIPYGPALPGNSTGGR